MICEALREYGIIKQLSQSRSVTTYALVHSISKKNFVCKIINVKDFEHTDALEIIEASKQALKFIDSQSIVKNRVVQQTADKVITLRPWIDKKSLPSYLEDLHGKPRESVLAIWKSIVRIYIYLHGQGFYPNLIKPSNIFIGEDNSVVITDIYKPSSQNRSSLHIPHIFDYGFMAPEYFTESSPLNSKSDTWSLGVLLFYMLECKLPWVTNNFMNIMKQISTFDIKSCASAQKFEPEVYQILEQIFKLNPDERSSLCKFVGPLECKLMKHNQLKGAIVHQILSPGVKKLPISCISHNRRPSAPSNLLPKLSIPCHQERVALMSPTVKLRLRTLDPMTTIPMAIPQKSF